MSSSTGFGQEEETHTPALPIWEQFRRRPEVSSSAESAMNPGILSQHNQPFPATSGTNSKAVFPSAMQKAPAPQNPSLAFSDRPIMARPRQAFLPLASQNVVNDDTHVPELAKTPDLMGKRLELAHFGDSNDILTNEQTNGKSHIDDQESMSQESVPGKVSDSAFHLVFRNKDYPPSSTETDKKSFCLKHFSHDTCNAAAKTSESLEPTPSPYSNNTSPSKTAQPTSSGTSPSNNQPKKPNASIPPAATKNGSTTVDLFPSSTDSQHRPRDKQAHAVAHHQIEQTSKELAEKHALLTAQYAQLQARNNPPARRISQGDTTSSPDRLGLAIKRLHEKTKKKNKQTDEALPPAPAVNMPIRSKKPETNGDTATQRPRTNTVPHSPYATSEIHNLPSPYAPPSPHDRDLATLCALLPAPQALTQHARPSPVDINRFSTYTPGFAPMVVSKRDMEAAVEVDAEVEAEEKWDDVEISDDEGWEKVCELEDLDWEVVAPRR